MAFIHSVAFLAGLALVSSTEDETILGGFTQQTAVPDDIDILVDALSNATTYNENVTALICLIAIENLETQVVAGTNYKFQVAGCTVDSEEELGACNDRDCDYSSYDIVIYSQPWTDTLKVKSIKPVE